jgi:hypothetical protein
MAYTSTSCAFVLTLCLYVSRCAVLNKLDKNKQAASIQAKVNKATDWLDRFKRAIPKQRSTR